VSEETENYWKRALGRRYARRSVLRGAALTGVGLAGAGLLACKASPSSNPSAASTSASSQTQAPKGGAVNSLVGHTQPEEKGASPVDGGTLNWWIGANPPTLDPHKNVSVNTLYLSSAVLSRLFRFKSVYDVTQAANLAIEPDLAQTAESSDAQTWTVKLRPDTKFQNVAPVNGRAVEAEDVKQTFLRATSPTSVNAGNLGMIDPAQIETPDKSTVVFKLKYPYAPFNKEMASASYSWIMPREAIAGAYDTTTKIIGSGPFIFDTFTPDIAVTFKKNPDYYEKGRPHVDGVRLAIIPDVSQRYAQFSGGHMDYLRSVLQSDVPALQQQNPKADVIKTFGNGNGVMYYNLREPNSIFQDIRVRQAVSLAMDRDGYAAASGFQGQFLQTFSVPPGVGKWSALAEDYPADTLQWYKFDLQKAKQLMEAAGGSKLSIKMIYPAGNPADPQLGKQAETAYSMLKQLPWNISYSTVDYNKDWINGGKGFGYPGGGVPADSMAWWGWSTRSEVDEYLFSFWHSKGAGNFMHVSDPQIDSGIDKARAVLNEDDRVKAYKDVQRYIASKVYCLMGMVNGLSFEMTAPRVHNFLEGDGTAYGIGSGFWSNVWLKA
jgi:peptide/nickel transport system substrate-binding protein